MWFLWFSKLWNVFYCFGCFPLIMGGNLKSIKRRQEKQCRSHNNVILAYFLLLLFLSFLKQLEIIPQGKFCILTFGLTLPYIPKSICKHFKWLNKRLSYECTIIYLAIPLMLNMSFSLVCKTLYQKYYEINLSNTSFCELRFLKRYEYFLSSS